MWGEFEMENTMKTLKTMVALAVMVAATMMSAEQKQVTNPTANVPFSFKVGDQLLPAGKYQVRVTGKALLLTSESGRSVVSLSHGVEAADPAEKSELEFVNNGGTRQLYRVWFAGYNAGLELSLPKAGQKIAETNSATTTIAVGK